ncbi:MAG TPA: LptF/LptG family permease [Bacteroidota bacterium]|nr:LptF/LptG family permease [Bacteroidota bacterium]
MRGIFRQRLLIERYILRAHFGPFLFSLVTLMFVFLLQFIMKFIDQLVGKGLTPWVIIELIALSLAWMLVLAVPMSVLVATLMAFGDLSSRNEITAMKACGTSTYRMMLPSFAGALIIGLLLIWFNNDVLPESNHRLKTLTIDIKRKKPTINLRNGIFSQDIPGYSILVRKTFEKTNDLEGVTLFDYTNPGVNVTITAERGTISFSPDFRKLIMDLQQGEIHELDLQRMMAYRKVRFETHRITMNVEGFDFTRSSESAFQRGNRELGAPAMMAIVDSFQRAKQTILTGLRERMRKQADLLLAGRPDTTVSAYTYVLPAQATYAALNDARTLGASITTELFRLDGIDLQRDQYMVEIHKKYSIPAACVVFVLIGVPLGIMARRGGFGTAATLSLGFFVLYYACLIGGEKLADRAIVSPFVGMWSANIIISLMGLYLTMRVARETVFINWALARKLIPSRWRNRFAFEESEDPGRI